MRTAGLDREAVLARIEDFHGHLGPYVVFGFRAGLLALRTLGARGHFDVEAVVNCGDHPPLSCFTDGVQLSSGCTTGKGNLRAGGSRSPEAAVTFRRRLTQPGPGNADLAVTVKVRPEAECQAAAWSAELGGAAAGRRIWDLPDDELFVVLTPTRQPETWSAGVGRTGGIGAPRGAGGQARAAAGSRGRRRGCRSGNGPIAGLLAESHRPARHR